MPRPQILMDFDETWNIEYTNWSSATVEISSKSDHFYYEI